MKNQNGMSYIMLLICVIIIIVAIVTGIYFMQMKLKEEKLETIKTEMIAVQSKVRIISEEVTMKKEGVSYIGKKVSENLEDETIKSLIEKNIIVSENYEEFYILEDKEFNELGLENYSIKKIIVDYKTCEIIYTEGFDIDGKTCYKLSEFKSIDEPKDNEVNEEVGEM